MLKVYYSHSKILRGTSQEKEDIGVLETLGFKVDNPFSPIYSDLWESDGFDFGRTLIDAADVFAFRALPDGSIASGVAKELEYAMSLDKPVIELPSSMKRRMLTVEETTDYFKSVGYYKSKK